MSGNRGPGWQRHPDHRITTHPTGVRVQVMFDGEILADSRNAIQLTEDGYPNRYYIPRKDVRMERLVRSGHRSYCPFKGHASYYSLQNGPKNAVWSYEDPYDEMVVIKGLLAFYPEKVDSITTD